MTDDAIARSLHAGALVVALARPDAMTDDALSTGLTWLDASERERCAAFHFARDRRIYLAAHALTRALLNRPAPQACGSIARLEKEGT